MKAFAAIATITAAVLGVLALLAVKNGNSWRVEAENALLQLENSESRERSLRAENESVQGLLEASERDVVELEERLKEVANEKAQAQDDEAAAIAYAEATEDLRIQTEVLRRRAENLAMLFSECALGLGDAMNETIEALNNFTYSNYYDVNRLNRIIQQAWATCDVAYAEVDRIYG